MKEKYKAARVSLGGPSVFFVFFLQPEEEKKSGPVFLCLSASACVKQSQELESWPVSALRSFPSPVHAFCILIGKMQIELLLELTPVQWELHDIRLLILYKIIFKAYTHKNKFGMCPSPKVVLNVELYVSDPL